MSKVKKEFKVGDKVRRISRSWGGNIKVGDEGVVSRVHGLSTIELQEKGRMAFDADCFELVHAFKAMKFRVKNSKHSKMIQLKLFELGYRWAAEGQVVVYRWADFLYAGESGYILFGPSLTGFKDSGASEMLVQPHTTYNLVEAPVVLVPPPPETVELNGKTYLKADLEAALQKLTPMQRPVANKTCCVGEG